MLFFEQQQQKRTLFFLNKLRIEREIIRSVKNNILILLTDGAFNEVFIKLISSTRENVIKFSLDIP